ncbi:MAG: 6-carboxytetrahydropterin synthase QueD [Bacteroidetes bacterium]|nr:6-carboxytetrahydropterin synthase QueD [Bacteroidota bacterium]MBK8659119.1 6-carboxytetrahydropterin synthase QueD [Bacteroidota bacterium]
MEIYKTFRFEAAHYLPHVAENHKCRNMHGHSYKFTIYVQGEVNPESGWVVDFHDIKLAIAPTVDELDHQVLNSVLGLENPTAENITIWLWNRIKPLLPQLSKIHLKETETSGCVYEGAN